jgi:hypothetical protein
MFFGRTLFAGALVAGYVTATGVGAFASAQASAAAAVVYKGKTTAVAQAHSQADALRLVLPEVLSASAAAEVQGQALVHFNLYGHALTQAIAQASAWGEFFGQASIAATSQAKATAYRRVRMKQQPPVKAYAEGEGDPQIYYLAQGRTAHLRANLIGTTDYVGRGVAEAHSHLVGAGEKAIGVRQDAPGFAFAEGAPITTAGGIGNGLAEATGWADAAVVRNGVRVFEVFGSSAAECACQSLTVVVFQPQFAYAKAQIKAAPLHTRGFGGAATGRASAQGEGSLIQTGVLGAPGAVRAVASARASRTAAGYGQIQATASLRGRARLHSNGKGSAGSLAALHASLLTLRIRVTARGSGQAQADAVRVLQAFSRTEATATAAGFNQVNDLVHAPEDRTLVVETQERLLVVEAEPRVILV